MPEFDQDQWGRRPYLLEAARLRRDLYRLLTGVFSSGAFNLRDAIANLANDFELPEIEHSLINVAIGVRILLDREQTRTDDAECGVLIPDINNEQTFQRLSLREACNKIIHASTRSYDVDNPVSPTRLEPVLHLHGSRGSTRWRVRLDLVRFAAHVEALATSPPDQ